MPRMTLTLQVCCPGLLRRQRVWWPDLGTFDRWAGAEVPGTRQLYTWRHVQTQRRPLQVPHRPSTQACPPGADEGGAGAPA